MKELFDKLVNLETYKIYHIIIVFTMLFSFTFFIALYEIDTKVKKITKQNQILILKDIEYTISSWMLRRINEIENSAKFIVANKNYNDRKKLQSIYNIIIKDGNFDAIQILIEDNIFYFNDSVMIDYRSGYRDKNALSYIDPLKTKWYIKTKKTHSTTLEQMKKHGYLKQRTVNLCTPIIDKNEFYGVLCGIIKTDLLFQKIKKLNIPSNFFYFIKNKSDNMLIGLKDKNIKSSILDFFKHNKLDEHLNEIEAIKINNNIVIVKSIDKLGWHIGSGVKKEHALSVWMRYIEQHSIFLILFFILFLIVVNTAYEFLYRRSKKRQDEYEKVLQYRSRLSEVGELVSGINHQLKQPLNSLALTISTTQDLKEKKLLTSDILDENILLCKKAIKIMDNTIDIFRNFYRCDASISKFCLKDCIDGVLYVNHVDFTRHNIIIDFQQKTTKNFIVESIENYVQQILLVLILNAKDSIIENNKTNKQISILTSEDEEFINIDVLDFGGGVSDELAKNIFSKFKHSNKKRGFGIGLVFAKKLAKEKLMGDLILLQQKNPTIFRLKLKNIKDMS